MTFVCHFHMKVSVLFDTVSSECQCKAIFLKPVKCSQTDTWIMGGLLSCMVSQGLHRIISTIMMTILLLIIMIISLFILYYYYYYYHNHTHHYHHHLHHHFLYNYIINHISFISDASKWGYIGDTGKFDLLPSRTVFDGLIIISLKIPPA